MVETSNREANREARTGNPGRSALTRNGSGVDPDSAASPSPATRFDRQTYFGASNPMGMA
jgi:hypothetical protein